MKAPSYEDKPEWGLVISVGDKVNPKRWFNFKSKTDLTAGDVILYMSYGGTKVDSLGQDFIYVRQEDIVSVHNKVQREEDWLVEQAIDFLR